MGEVKAMPGVDNARLSGVLAPVTAENCNSGVPQGAGGVEVRADLFDTREESLSLVSSLAGDFAVLVTPRHPSQGGAWRWSEQERASYCKEAIERGAVLVDVEHGTEAAAILQGAGVKVLLSWHDFEGMISGEDLEGLTSEMEAGDPAAIKVVPTAGKLADAVRMLEWVERRGEPGPARIGFAMGPHGVAGRILSLSRGAPWTYGANGSTLAPGQLPVQDMVELYRAGELDRETRVFGVAGNPVGHSLSPAMHNPSLREAGINAVYLPFHLEKFSELDGCWDALNLDGLSVTIPFKADALKRADEVSEEAARAGAVNTLVRGKEQSGDGLLRGMNTDFDGVLGPLRRHLGDLEGIEVAVVGNGGAARGAVQALLDAGARPTIYCRNPERGGAVAGALGIEALPLRDIKPGAQRVVINSTPLGLQEGDPSPVPAEVFTGETIAFDMVYEPPMTSFLAQATSQGARAIRGDEMLIAQGLVQFELFTGLQASPEAFAAGLEAARSRKEA